VKWFPPQKKGLITGLVVAGFGVAPVYIAPLSKWMLSTLGIAASFRILGVAFMITATGFAQLIRNPPPEVAAAAKAAGGPAKAGAVDATWRDMLRSPAFYSFYVQYACAATAGLMIIGHMAKIVSVQSSGAIQAGFVFVALLAAFNASGRVIAGVISDRIGRVVTIALVCGMQALAMFFFSKFTTIGTFVLGAAIVGACYGACLSLFPATVADRWGTKNLGVNYGLLFTGWGVGGVLGPTLAGRIADATGSYTEAFDTAGVLLVVALFLAMFSYVDVSYSVTDRSLTIKLGGATRKAA
jgi:nitrate/nitrite transporter NarK